MLCWPASPCHKVIYKNAKPMSTNTTSFNRPYTSNANQQACWLCWLQLKATAEKLSFLRQVAILEGSNSRQHLTQLHFVLEKCIVQRGHVIIMEGQPCAGMFFIVTGQVAILARRPSPAAVNAADSDAELTQHASSELQASHWSSGPTSSWWGQAGADQHGAGENPFCSCCFTVLGSARMSCSM